MSASLPARLIERLRGARSIAVLTGAGISAESGVPTFRDAQSGLWARFDPRELATPAAFARDPKLVWDWYAWRRQLVAAARPNAGHMALATLERRVGDFELITQNVDGLHRKAGSANVVELHGDVGRVRCSRCARAAAAWDERGADVPRCASCGALLRPDVVWFDEPLPADALARAERAARSCDALLVIGTSAEVHPAAMLPEYALRRGALVVEVNPAATPLTARVDFALAAKSASILPALVDAAWPPAR
jgi:NAD-dependent deacetylase